MTWRRTDPVTAGVHLAALAVWPFALAYTAIVLALDRLRKKTQ